jgi:hypothetical protein
VTCRLSGDVTDLQLAGTRLAEIGQDAEQQLARMRDQIRELNEALRIDVNEDDLPPIELPEAVAPGWDGRPLPDSRWDFGEPCQALIVSKASGDG